ncbi:MAG: LysR family transcriptional regulator [Pseudomonadota bacterium]
MTDHARLSLRVDLPGGGRFGPGKAALLSAISQTGSINAAARQLSMSYPKALRLIEQMNTDFEEPLVISHHGGRAHGGSELSELGDWVLTQYREICAEADTASRDRLRSIEAKLS